MAMSSQGHSCMTVTEGMLTINKLIVKSNLTTEPVDHIVIYYIYYSIHSRQIFLATNIQALQHVPQQRYLTEHTVPTGELKRRQLAPHDTSSVTVQFSPTQLSDFRKAYVL